MFRENELGLSDLFNAIHNLGIELAPQNYSAIQHLASKLGLYIEFKEELTSLSATSLFTSEEGVNLSRSPIAEPSENNGPVEYPSLSTSSEFPLLDTSLSETKENQSPDTYLKLKDEAQEPLKIEKSSSSADLKYNPLDIDIKELSRVEPETPIFDLRHERSILVDLVASKQPEGEIDVPILVESFSKGIPITTLPRTQVRSTRSRVHILIEDDDSLDYYEYDLNHIIEATRAHLDTSKVDLFWFDRFTPFGNDWVIDEYNDDPKDYRTLNRKSPIFLFQSFGFTAAHDTDEESLEAISPFLDWAMANDIPVHLFTVRHPDHLPEIIRKKTKPIFWHHNPRLSVSNLLDPAPLKATYQSAIKSFLRMQSASKSSWSTLKLAETLTLASEISPGLVREMRIDHFRNAETILESDLWQSALARIRNSRGLTFYREDIDFFLSKVKQDPNVHEYHRTVARYREMSGAPEHLKFEEKLKYLGLIKGVNDLINDPEVLEKVGRLNATVDARSEPGFKLWLSSVTRRWSNQLKQLPNVKELYRTLNGTNPHQNPDQEVAITRRHFGYRTVHIRVTNKKIYFDEEPQNTNSFPFAIEVPDLDPVHLDVDQGAVSKQTVMLRKGGSKSIERSAFSHISIVNQFGDLYVIPVDLPTIIDPHSGLVRYNLIRTPQNELILLQEAYSHIQKIPSNKLPEIRGVPFGSRIEQPPHPNLVGRESIFSRIAIHLNEQNQPTPKLILLSGETGVGKTAVASHVAHRYGYYFAGGVFWLNVSDPEQVPLEIIECGRALNIENFNSLDETAKLEAVLKAWSEPVPRLILFDGCHADQDIEKWLPTTGGAAILAMTREASQLFSNMDAAHISLDTLIQDDSVNLLTQILQTRDDVSLPPTDDLLIEAVNLLGNFPTAIQLLGAYLVHFDEDGFEVTLEKLNTVIVDSVEFEADPTSNSANEDPHTFILSQLIELIFDKLHEDPIALNFLAFLITLAPDTPILGTLLEQGFEEVVVQLPSAINLPDFSTYLNIQTILINAKLLGQIDDHKYMLPLLVRNALSNILEKALKTEAFKHTVQFLSRATGQNNRESSPIALRPWENHIVHVAGQLSTENLNGFDEDSLELYSQLGLHFLNERLMDRALYYFEKANELAELSGKQNIQLANTLNNLGLVHRQVNNIDLAENYFREAIEIYSQQSSRLAEEGAALENLGTLILIRGDHREAKKFLRQALELRQSLYKEGESFEIAASHTALGQCDFFWGESLLDINVADANGHFEMALAEFDAALEADNVLSPLNIAQNLSNKAGTLLNLNRYEEAQENYLQALELYVEELGADHLRTADIYHNLGVLFHQTKNRNEAKEMFARSVNIRSQHLGIEHVDTLRSKQQLDLVQSPSTKTSDVSEEFLGNFDNGHAFLVGVGNYASEKVSSLNNDIVNRDTTALGRTLKDPEICGYPANQVNRLEREKATVANIKHELEALSTRTNIDSTLFLFFASHGLLGTDGKWYFTTHDTEFEFEGGYTRVKPGTALNEEDLTGLIRAIPAKKKFIVFNTCFSGHLSRTLAPKSLSPSKNLTHAALRPGKGDIIITAAGEKEESWFSKTSDLTFFTEELINVLKGKGVLDNGGFIGAFNLYSTLHAKVKNKAFDKFEVSQNPELTVLKAVGAMPVALFPRSVDQRNGTLSLLNYTPEAEPNEIPSFHPISEDRALRYSKTVFASGSKQINIDTVKGDFIGGDLVKGNVYKAARDIIIDQSETVINTHGAAAVRGDITIERGEFAGRDQHRIGDVESDAVVAQGENSVALGRGAVSIGQNNEGNVITGSNNVVGNDNINIKGDVGVGAAVGKEAQVNAENIAGGNIQVNQPVSVNTQSEVLNRNQVFAKIDAALQSAGIDPSILPLIEAAIKGLRTEALKGNNASSETVSQLMNMLAANDTPVKDVALSLFSTPIPDLSSVFQEAANKLKRQ